MLKFFLERSVLPYVFLNLVHTVMLALLHLKDLELASAALHKRKITLRDVLVKLLRRNSSVTAFVWTEVRREVTGRFMFLDLWKVKNFLAPELFIRAFDSKSLLNTILHKLVDLEQLRVRSIPSAFVRALLSLLDTRLAVVLGAVLALRR